MSEVVTIIGDGTTFGCLNRSWLRDCSCSTWPRSGWCGCDRLWWISSVCDWFFNLVVIVAIYDLRRNGNLAERSFKFLVLAGQESPWQQTGRPPQDHCCRRPCWCCCACRRRWCSSWTSLCTSPCCLASLGDWVWTTYWFGRTTSVVRIFLVLRKPLKPGFS